MYEAGTRRQKPQALEISRGTGMSSTLRPRAFKSRSARMAAWLVKNVTMRKTLSGYNLYLPRLAPALADYGRNQAGGPEFRDGVAGGIGGQCGQKAA